MPERTRKAYQEHYKEKLCKRNQKIRTMEVVTIRQLEEDREEQESPEEPQEQPKGQESPQEQKEETTKQEDQENKGPQEINPMEFLMQEDEGPQEKYELDFLGQKSPQSWKLTLWTY